MLTGQIADVDARENSVKASFLTWVNHHDIVVKVEEYLLIIMVVRPNIRVDVLQDFVQVLDVCFS